MPNLIYKVNKFSDMTKEEFKAVHACYKGHQTPMISTRSKGFSINDWNLCDFISQLFKN